MSLFQSVLHSRSLGTRNSEAVVSQTKLHSVRIQRGLDVRMFCSSRTVEGLPEETAAVDGNCGNYDFAWYLQDCDPCGHNCAAWTSGHRWCRDPFCGLLGLLFNGFRELIVLGQSGRRVKIITDVHLVHRVVHLYLLRGQCAAFKRWFSYFSTGHRNRHDEGWSGGEPWHHRAVRV